MSESDEPTVEVPISEVTTELLPDEAEFREELQASEGTKILVMSDCGNVFRAGSEAMIYEIENE